VVRNATLEQLVRIKGDYDKLVESQVASSQIYQKALSLLEARVEKLEARPDENSIKNVIRYAMKAHWRTVDLIEQVSGADKPAACPLCGDRADSTGFKEVISHCRFFGGKLVRHECPNCEVIFGPQKMFALDPEMLDLDYRALYSVYAEGDSTQSIIRTFHLLKPTKDGVYLDFGSGGEWSDAIQVLREQGWNVLGFEPSVNHASEHVFSKWEEVERSRYDGIFSHNVLEHLFDPVGTTRRLRDLLTPGGRLVHATPCFSYSFEYSHYHVFFFTGRSPDVLSERAGMAIAEWVRDGEFIACVMRPRELGQPEK